VDIHFDEFWKIAGENTLENLELNGISFARAGGSFSWQGGEPLFLDQSLWRKEDEKLQLQGFLPLDQDEATLDLEVFTQEFSLDFLASFLPDFPELGGRVSLDFRMAGSLEEPVLAGSGYLQEGALRYFNFPGGVEDLEGEIRLEGDNLVFEEIKGRYSEGGSLNLGGKIGMEGWFFRHYDLLLEVEGLHIKHGSVDGYGDGEMTIKGPFDEPEMVGYLDVYDTVIKFPFDWPHEETEADIADDFHFELTFHPRSNIRVRDGNYDIQVQTGELTLDNRTGELEMVGEVSSRQGSVDFYNTSFRLIEGRARFHRFGESIPHISASAQTRVQDNQIIVYLEGPALDMDLSFSSQPPRDEQEIIELLVYRGGLGELVRGDLTGVVREELWRIIGETFRTSFLVHLETSISDFLELDEFKITPILLGEEERIEFHMGKALTDRIYLTYTQAFTATGDQRELGLEYRLGDNIFFSGSLQDEGQFQLGIEFSFPF